MGYDHGIFLHDAGSNPLKKRETNRPCAAVQGFLSYRRERMKPLIGITVNYDIKDEIGMVTHFGTVNQQWNYIASDYVDAVVKAGGIPVLIPIYQNAEVTRAVVDRLDGILISGGNDVDPRRFGVRAKSYCGSICEE